MGIIPPVTRLKSKIISVGIVEDYGVIPPKNYFTGKITTIGINGDILKNSEQSIMFYQVM